MANDMFHENVCIITGASMGIGEGHVSLSDDAGLIMAFAVVMQRQS